MTRRPVKFCRDSHLRGMGPETYHWNEGQGQDSEDGSIFYELAWDCLEAPDHEGWCRSEIVSDDIGMHRLYWTEEELHIIRCGPPAVTVEQILEGRLWMSRMKELDPSLDFKSLLQSVRDCGWNVRIIEAMILLMA